MKKTELLQLIAALPEDADIQVADLSNYDTDEIVSIVPAVQYNGWCSRAKMYAAIAQQTYVLMVT